MSIDLVAAGQGAVFALLDESATLKDLSGVFDHVPQGTRPPLTRVGRIASTPVGAKGEQLEELIVDIETVYRGQSRSELFAIMKAARGAIEAGELSFPGVEFHEPEWLGAETDGPASDGVTYAGIQQFSIMAEPA